MLQTFLLTLLSIGVIFLLIPGIRIMPHRTYNSENLSLNSCNMLRGFFALLVVFHHLSQRCNVGGVFHGFTYVGFLCVSVFFFFSGYGLQKKYIADAGYRKKFLLRRLPNVLFPYIIVTGIYWLAHAFAGKIYSLKYIVESFENGDPLVSHSWYVIAIIIFYIFFWMLMCLCKQRYELMLLFDAIFSIFWILFCHKAGYGSWWYNSTHLFFIGMFWAIYEQQIRRVFERFYGILTAVGFLGFILSFWLYLGTVREIKFLLSIFSSALFVIELFAVTEKVQIGNRILNYLGAISFELYLIHGLVTSVLKQVSLLGKNAFIWCIAVIAVSVAAAHVLHFIFRIMLLQYRSRICSFSNK